MANNFKKFSQPITILEAKRENAYMVTVTEWNVIKKKINNINVSSTFFHDLGLVLLGITPGAFISWLGGGSQIYIIASVLALCVGGMSLYFSKREANNEISKKEDAIEQMEIIENRFKQEEEPSATQVVNQE